MIYAYYENTSPWRSANIAVDRILAVDLHKIWAGLQPYLDRTPEMWEDGYTREHFCHDILMGSLQLWAFTESNEVLAYAATQIRVTGSKRFVVLQWLAGKRMTEPKLARFGIDCLHRYAAYHGISEVRIEGRKGWQRLLAKLNFKPKHVVLTAPVNKERMN